MKPYDALLQEKAVDAFLIAALEMSQADPFLT
jgi:hypothetical protein